MDGEKLDSLREDFGVVTLKRCVASFEAPRSLILAAAEGVRGKVDYYPRGTLTYNRELGMSGVGDYSIFVGDPPGRAIIRNGGEFVADISVADLLAIADGIESGETVTTRTL